MRGQHSLAKNSRNNSFLICFIGGTVKGGLQLLPAQELFSNSFDLNFLLFPYLQEIDLCFL